jgi:hypothetical protein
MTRCTCRHRIIYDPRRPFRLRIGVAYRVVDEDTQLVIRPASAEGVLGSWTASAGVNSLR